MKKMYRNALIKAMRETKGNSFYEFVEEFGKELDFCDVHAENDIITVCYESETDYIYVCITNATNHIREIEFVKK